jgi:hypothetical protein
VLFRVALPRFRELRGQKRQIRPRRARGDHERWRRFGELQIELCLLLLRLADPPVVVE